MRGWDGAPMASYFRALEALPIDANTPVPSEANAHLPNHPDLVVLEASTGLGCGIVVDGRLARSATGAADECGCLKVAAAAAVCLDAAMTMPNSFPPIDPRTS